VKSETRQQKRTNTSTASLSDLAGTAVIEEEKQTRRLGQDYEALDRLIDSITRDFSRKGIRSRLKALANKGSINAATICDHILTEQTEHNIKTLTAESKVKSLLWLSKFLNDKPFEEMTKQDILSYLNSIRKPTSIDPQQKWIGSYNNRLRYYAKFFRWLYNKEEPDYRKRISPPCIQGLKQLPRLEKSSYKPSDLWDSREHSVFLKYCPNVRDRCYHAMANDMSARPHEILNLKIKDIIFKSTDEGIQYAEVLIRDGKTKPRTLPFIDSLPYLKEWLQLHPTGGNRDSWVFVSLADASIGTKLKRDSLLAKYQYQYKEIHFPRLLQDQTVSEPDKAVIRNMLTKPWNLYVFRHSALTEKSQILTESTLRDHAGWTMTSKMPTVYLHYFGTESAKKLLEAKGIIQHNRMNLNVLKSKSCPYCNESNKPDSKFGTKCKFMLSFDAFNEVTNEAEETKKKLAQLEIQQQERFKEMQEQIAGLMERNIVAFNWLKQEMEIRKKEEAERQESNDIDGITFPECFKNLVPIRTRGRRKIIINQIFDLYQPPSFFNLSIDLSA
jgi:integrase